MPTKPKSRPGLRTIRRDLEASLRRQIERYKPKKLGAICFCWNGYFAGYALRVSTRANGEHDDINVPLDPTWLDETRRTDREWLLGEAFRIYRKVRDEGALAALQIEPRCRFVTAIGCEEFSTDRSLPWSANDTGTELRAKLRKRPPTIAGAWRRIEAWLLEQGGAEAVAALPGPASERALARADKRLRRRIPAPLRELWSVHDGGVTFGNWPLLSVAEAVDERKHDRLPISSDGAGNSVCFIYASGEIIEICHDPYYRAIVARSLRAWLGERIAALEVGEFELDDVIRR